MITIDKKILIVDENGFSRICSALLTNCGYRVDIINNIDDYPKMMKGDPFDLVITSYPFGSTVLKSMRQQTIPVIVLTDGIDERLMSILNAHQQSYCMIKPVDYDKFRTTVRQAVERTLQFEGGYCIV